MSSSKPTGDQAAHSGIGHVVPMRVLIGTWAALVVLTWVTVTATYIDLGNLNIVIALAIAVVKSSFVVLFFMHLRYDKPFHAVVFISATLFVMLFISLALMDTKEYAESKIPGYAPEIEQVLGADAVAEPASPGETTGDGTATEAPAETEAEAGHS